MTGRDRQDIFAETARHPETTMGDVAHLEVLLDIRDLLERLVTLCERHVNDGK